jgi:hypothetical protein
MEERVLEMDCWMEGGFQIIAQPFLFFFFFPAIQPLFLKQKSQKEKGVFWVKIYSIVYIYPFFFLG